MVPLWHVWVDVAAMLPCCHCVVASLQLAWDGRLLLRRGVSLCHFGTAAGCLAGLGGLPLLLLLCAGARPLGFVASCRAHVVVTWGSLGAAGVGFPVTACAWIRVDDSVSMTLACASSSSEYCASCWQTRHPRVARTSAGSRGGLAVGPPWHGVGRRRWPSALGSHPSAPACALLRRGRRQ